jgi:hypothetical protein
MPIPVTCPGCKKSFNVSDQHAGKKGNCPNCKAVIAIPKASVSSATKVASPAGNTPAAKSTTATGGKKGVPPAKRPAASSVGQSVSGPPGNRPGSTTTGKPAEVPAAAPMGEVKIHEPEAAGPKGVSGRPVSKPIARRETKIAMVPAMIAAAGALVTLAVSRIAREPLQANFWLRALGLALISAPLAAGGYTFLRDDELEPHRGRWFWFRSSVCAAIYIGLWGCYYLIPADITKEAWSWCFIALPFLAIGAGTALATLDLDFTNGFFHYCFYVLVTLLLGWVAGLSMPWAVVSR